MFHFGFITKSLCWKWNTVIGIQIMLIYLSYLKMFAINFFLNCAWPTLRRQTTVAALIVLVIFKAAVKKKTFECRFQSF